MDSREKQGFFKIPWSFFVVEISKNRRENSCGNHLDEVEF